MKHENLLLKSALALAIVDLVLIAAILLQVNSLVKDVVEVQNRQLEIEGMKERLGKAKEFKEPEVKPEGKEISDKEFSITTNKETGWKVYTNQKYNYQLEFPNDWVVADARMSNLHLTKDTGTFAFSLPPLGFGYSEQDAKKVSEVTLKTDIVAKKLEFQGGVVVELQIANERGLIKFNFDKNISKEENLKALDQILFTVKRMD